LVTINQTLTIAAIAPPEYTASGVDGRRVIFSDFAVDKNVVAQS
jgi:hypothetical protein